jgi:hypothetical protein
MSAGHLLWRNFLVFYPSSNPSTCLTLHPCPIPSHPHIPLGGDDHLTVISCLAAWPIHRHLSRIDLSLSSTLSTNRFFRSPQGCVQKRLVQTNRVLSRSRLFCVTLHSPSSQYMSLSPPPLVFDCSESRSASSSTRTSSSTLQYTALSHPLSPTITPPLMHHHIPSYHPRILHFLRTITLVPGTPSST